MRKMILAATTFAALVAIPAGANAQSSTVGGAIIGAGTGAVIGGGGKRQAFSLAFGTWTKGANLLRPGKAPAHEPPSK